MIRHRLLLSLGALGLAATLAFSCATRTIVLEELDPEFVLDRSYTEALTTAQLEPNNTRSSHVVSRNMAVTQYLFWRYRKSGGKMDLTQPEILNPGTPDAEVRGNPFAKFFSADLPCQFETTELGGTNPNCGEVRPNAIDGIFLHWYLAMTKLHPDHVEYSRNFIDGAPFDDGDVENLAEFNRSQVESAAPSEITDLRTRDRYARYVLAWMGLAQSPGESTTPLIEGRPGYEGFAQWGVEEPENADATEDASSECEAEESWICECEAIDLHFPFMRVNLDSVIQTSRPLIADNQADPEQPTHHRNTSLNEHPTPFLLTALLDQTKDAIVGKQPWEYEYQVIASDMTGVSVASENDWTLKLLQSRDYLYQLAMATELATLMQTLRLPSGSWEMRPGATDGYRYSRSPAGRGAFPEPMLLANDIPNKIVDNWAQMINRGREEALQGTASPADVRKQMALFRCAMAVPSLSIFAFAQLFEVDESELNEREREWVGTIYDLMISEIKRANSMSDAMLLGESLDFWNAAMLNLRERQETDEGSALELTLICRDSERATNSRCVPRWEDSARISDAGSKRELEGRSDVAQSAMARLQEYASEESYPRPKQLENPLEPRHSRQVPLAKLAYDIGFLFRTIEQVDSAVSAHTLATQLDPENFLAHWELSLISLRRAGEDEQRLTVALEHMKSALRALFYRLDQRIQRNDAGEYWATEPLSFYEFYKSNADNYRLLGDYPLTDADLERVKQAEYLIDLFVARRGMGCRMAAFWPSRGASGVDLPGDEVRPTCPSRRGTQSLVDVDAYESVISRVRSNFLNPLFYVNQFEEILNRNESLKVKVGGSREQYRLVGAEVREELATQYQILTDLILQISNEIGERQKEGYIQTFDKLCEQFRMADKRKADLDLRWMVSLGILSEDILNFNGTRQELLEVIDGVYQWKQERHQIDLQLQYLSLSRVANVIALLTGINVTQGRAGADSVDSALLRTFNFNDPQANANLANSKWSLVRMCNLNSEEAAEEGEEGGESSSDEQAEAGDNA